VVVLSVVLVFFFNVYNAVGNDIGGDNSSGSDISGVGTKHTSMHISTIKDLAKITYPNQMSEGNIESSEYKGTTAYKKLLMTRPRNFEKEGIYIWRSVEGAWNIRIISPTGLKLSGSITAEKEIDPVDENLTSFKRSSSNTININQDSFTLNFKTQGAYVDFDLSIDGKKDSSNIYLGYQLYNPQDIPFRIENRPLVSPKGSSKKTTSGKRPEPTSINNAVTSDSCSPEKMTNHSSGGSSGGSYRHGE